MTLATFRAAAEHIARTGTITPHQLAAWQAAWERATPEQRQAFTDDWRAQGSPAAPAPTTEPAWLAPALKIIKQFEGCHLDAYLCPSGVPTIGWGSTRLIDRPVQLGDKISQQMADDLLRNDVEMRHRELVKLLPMISSWPGHRVAALISWAYNVGMGAAHDSTLRRRLLEGDDPVQTIREELPRWDKAINGKPLAGLTRRRAAEVALFVGQQLQQQTPQTPGRVTPQSPFSALLTPHIRVGEFALNQEARRFDHQHQVDTAAELAAFLERVRKQFRDLPIIITSGYRPPAINRSVGGASGSEHLFDAPGVGAVDFYVAGANIVNVQHWCDREWPYSVGYGAPKGFVHLGIRKGRPRVRWDY